MKILEYWISKKDAAKLCESEGVSPKSIYYHLRTGGICAYKINLLSRVFWLIYKPSLLIYISAVIKGTISDPDTWRWDRLLEKGVVKNPRKPRL